MNAPQLRHYTADNIRTLCGRMVTITMNVTIDASRVTCRICKGRENSDAG